MQVKIGWLFVPFAFGAGAHSGVFGLTLSGTLLLHASAMVEIYRPQPPPPKPPPPEPRDRLIIETVALDEAKEEEERPEAQVVAIPPPRPAWSEAPRHEDALPDTLRPRSERLADTGPVRTLPSYDKLIPPSDDRASAKAIGRDTRANSQILAMLTTDDSAQLAALIGDSVGSPVLMDTLEGAAIGNALDSGVAVGGVGTGLVGSGGGLIGASGLGRMRSTSAVTTDKDALRRAYISRIGRAIRRVREYPIAAQDDGLEGTVGLLITIGSGGELRAVVIARSSGHPTLDDAAVASVKKLGSLPPPPAELEWDEQSVRVSLVYSLDL